MKPQKTLFLLDAMALIYRAYFALNKNPRVNSKGLNTSAMLGFGNTLWDVIRNERPTHIGVAFDTMAPSVRHIEYIDYKANRQRMPEELALSIPWIKKLIEAFRIPILECDGFEADDVLGTLAIQASEKGFTTYIMTSDKDLGQMVSNNILIYRPGKFGNKAEKLGAAEVCEKFGISRPDQIKDMLGLWGDASDNIPGIPGIGEVTARKLIATFDTIENLLANVDLIENEKLREKIKTNAHMAVASKQLATIILDVPVPFDEEQLRWKEPDMPVLKALFDELEFRTFAQRIVTDLRQLNAPTTDLFGEPLEQQVPDYVKADIHTISSQPHEYHLADTPEKHLDLIQLLHLATTFCFDTETTSLSEMEAQLVGMSFAIEPGEAWYVPVSANQQAAQEIIGRFRPLFADPSKMKIGQNLKYDLSVLRNYDVEVAGPLFDTMIAHYLLEPDQRHNMDYLAETYLNYKPVPIEDLIGKKGAGQGSMRQVPLEKIKEYAAEDADVTLQLYRLFAPGLTEGGALDLFHRVEMPLVEVLMDMERQGVAIDIHALADISRQLTHELVNLEQEIFQSAGEEFNIASPKQLGVVLFEKMMIAEKPRTTRTGQYATGEDVLEKLRHKHPIIEMILEYRQLSKLKSTYVDALPLLVSPIDGRIHTSYNQAVASTGRLSSTNPNLQNIPVRTERGREIRKAFVSRNSDFVLMAADYSQVELRIIAHLANDEAMKEAFVHGHDIHAATAARVYGLPIEEVTRDQRRNAKSVNFGIVYGISAYGLSEQLGISRREAADIIEQYFSQYHGIKKWMDQSIAFARENGYVETLLGRRRYLRDITSANATVRGFAERNAINAPIQGSSADMIKIAMINIHREMNRRGMQSKMILQVHDELVFDALRSEIDELKIMVTDLMQQALPLSIPVVVDVNVGENWLEAH
ncbi:MAG TPA: DNA polymerase I [Bacteroidales bacterium]|nr:MAG: DNA polymerase I [Bacteroidetes bacterium GWE2_42_24]OFY30707.1 MAG: DNA polymerase I [Bacteroidetes bacterium GWF2_43_11]HAQ65389.1 DNA polymerase I [Bacteroidales bacterium]HBZ65702.1 DNA polymerase I [Bacteroidales bacterium]